MEPVADKREWMLAQIIKNPVLFREFINLEDINWKPLEDHERAWTACSASRVCMCCGRGVRKTTAMIEMMYWWMINGMFIPGDPGLLIFVPNKAQKDVIFPKFKTACERHWFISKLVSSNSINVQEGRIDFVNGFRLVLRIAGSEGKESNVISLHTARIWVDEAQDFPWKAWQSLYNVLKKEIPWHMLWVSGVPNGERKENVLFTCDQLDDDYVSFNISQAQMSDWTPELEYEVRKRYHALQQDSEDYKHYVLGQHGVPTFAVFDRVRFEKDDYEVLLLELTQSMYESTIRNNPDGTRSYHVDEVVVCLEPPNDPVLGRPKIGLGYDVGYSPDPTVFFIMYQDARTGKWRNLARYILKRIEYALQRETLLWLDQVYKFDFMGIDMGGPGKVVYQELTSELADQIYRERKFDERLYPVEFGGSITVAVQTIDMEIVEKKDNVKRVAVESVSRWVHEHRFVFSEQDTDLMDELERTKFTRSASGEPVYKTDNDHQFAAMMCAVMAYEHFYGAPLTGPLMEVKPKLLTARWLH